MRKPFTLYDLTTRSYDEIENETSDPDRNKAKYDMNPGKRAIMNIMNYSKSLVVLHSRIYGTCGLIIN